MHTPTQMVKNGQLVHFTHAYAGNLWYVTECGFHFPVPVADIGDATFELTDKALLFLRYIRAQHAVPIPEVFSAALHMAEGATLRFTRYRQGKLWYVNADGFTFPVPIGASAQVPFPAQAHQVVSFLPHLTAHYALVQSARQAQENAS